MMKVALVHDWMIHMRGGEKVLEAIAELYPEATIYTLFCDRERLSPSLQKMTVRTSFLQKLPWIKNYYRWLLPFLPWILGTLKIERCDLVISSSHCVAKGIAIPPQAKHISYIHTPMRYIWGFEKIYFDTYPFVIRRIIMFLLKYLRRWDLKTNDQVDFFVANSKNVQNRIEHFYHRESKIIYPPVDLNMFVPQTSERGDYYLVVSAFVPYKRVDLVIEAFNHWQKRLIIVGSGPLESSYHKIRKSRNISFLNSVTDTQLRSLFSEAKAVIFPTEEDFGIVPLEAQACGTPVIALGKGGALESVKHGVFFYEQTPEAIRQAVLEFETKSFDYSAIPQAVTQFNKDHFQNQFSEFVRECLGQGVEHAAP